MELFAVSRLKFTTDWLNFIFTFHGQFNSIIQCWLLKTRQWDQHKRTLLFQMIFIHQILRMHTRFLISTFIFRHFSRRSFLWHSCGRSTISKIIYQGNATSFSRMLVVNVYVYNKKVIQIVWGICPKVSAHFSYRCISSNQQSGISRFIWPKAFS